MQLIDREEELKALNEAYRLRPCLVVIYGRRRVGKTRLVVEWSRLLGKPVIYYHAVPASHEVNLNGLALAAARTLGIDVLTKLMFKSLDSLLETIVRLQPDIVIVVDEFTYWVRAEPRVVGELQRFVDHILPSTKTMVVLVGSLIGVMMGSVLGGGSPLYGRARLRLKLTPFKPWYVTLFHPWLSVEDSVRLFGLFGGIPYYHNLVPRGATVEEVIEKLIVSPLSPLRDEPYFLLREELQNPAPYFSVLEAIAYGRTRLSEISGYTGIAVQHLPRYISVLEMLDLVEHVRPLNSRRGWYRIKDPVVRTWFKIVRRLQPLIEAGAVKEAVREAKKILENMMGDVFEEIVLEYVRWLAAKGLISFTKIGKWVHKGVEIDLIAIDEQRRIVHAFEVKWARVGVEDVKRYARELRLKMAKTPFSDWSYKLHIVVRDVEAGEEVEGVEEDTVLHTLRSMPFKRG